MLRIFVRLSLVISNVTLSFSAFPIISICSSVIEFVSLSVLFNVYFNINVLFVSSSFDIGKYFSPYIRYIVIVSIDSLLSIHMFPLSRLKYGPCNIPVPLANAIIAEVLFSLYPFTFITSPTLTFNFKFILLLSLVSISISSFIFISFSSPFISTITYSMPFK